MVDLDRVRAALRALDIHVREHPELTEGDAPERLAAALEADEPDLTDALEADEPHLTDEPPPGSERRRERPARRDDRDP